MEYDVFISYGTYDRTVAESLCAYLEDGGLRCWIAPRNIASGSNYAGEITRAVRSVGTVVVICSRKSCHSNHIKNEVTLAFNQNKRILPYCLDDNPFDDDMEYFLSSKQQIRFSGNSKKDFEQIRHILGEQTQHKELSNKPGESTSRKHFRPALLSGIIFCLCLLGLALYFIFRNHSDANSPAAGISKDTVDTFTGGIVNGHPDGFGTYTFARPRRIDQHDAEERMAAPGDYINGSWENGHLDYGEWFDAKGKPKGFIQLGDYLDVESDWVLGTCEKP